MVRLSPKVEIINHFDNLIHRIDIDIEQCMENYKEYQVLGELKHFRFSRRLPFAYIHLIWRFLIECFDSNDSSENETCETIDEWSESTKVIDYLTQVRQRTISELRKAQEDSLENLKDDSCDLQQLKESKDVEEMRSRLFADKFYFQVHLKPRKEKYQESVVFSLFTIEVDFYLSSFDISFIE